MNYKDYDENIHGNILSSIDKDSLKNLNDRLRDAFLILKIKPTMLNYNITSNGNYRFIVIDADFSHLIALTNKKRQEIEEKVKSFNFRMSFINQDVLKLSMHDYNDASDFINSGSYKLGYHDLLTGILIDKVSLVLTDKMI